MVEAPHASPSTHSLSLSWSQRIFDSW
jgi:hypothetical protein